MTSKSPFKWRHFFPEIILWGVRWYCLYPISYRQLEKMMCDRGVEVDHSTQRALGPEVCALIWISGAVPT